MSATAPPPSSRWATRFCGGAHAGSAWAAAVLVGGRRDWRAGAVLAGVAAGYLPWFMYPERTIFFFYAMSFEPFLVLALVYAWAWFSASAPTLCGAGGPGFSSSGSLWRRWCCCPPSSSRSGPPRWSRTSNGACGCGCLPGSRAGLQGKVCRTLGGPGMEARRARSKHRTARGAGPRQLRHATCSWTGTRRTPCMPCTPARAPARGSTCRSAFPGHGPPVAKGLIAGGLAPGETVAVMSATRYEWTVVDQAIWFAGAVTVPIYETTSAHQVEWILHDSGARHVFAEDHAKAALASGGSSTPHGLATGYRRRPDGERRRRTAPARSLAAAGTGVTDAELERHRRAASLAGPRDDSSTPRAPRAGPRAASSRTPTSPGGGEPRPAPAGGRGPQGPHPDVPAAGARAGPGGAGDCLHAGTTVSHTARATKLMEDLAAFQPTFLLVVPRDLRKGPRRSRPDGCRCRQGQLFAAAARLRSTIPRPATPPPGAPAGPRAAPAGQAPPLRPAGLPQAAGRSAARCATRSPAPAR